MIPLTCYVCHRILANRQLYYEKKLKKICDDYELGKYKDYEECNKDKMNLVNSLGLKKYCCKQIVLTYVKLIDIIQ